MSLVYFLHLNFILKLISNERIDFVKKVIALISILVISSTLLVACGNKEEILVVSREEGSGTRSAFVELTGILEKDSNGNETDHTTKEAVTQMQTETVIQSVSGNKNAIGYISTGSLNDTVKAVSVDSFQPSIENIKSGQYKISRPFNIALKERGPLVDDFISYILSKEGQTIVSSSYISIDDNLAEYNPRDLEGKIVIAGSTSVAPLMENLAEEYMKLNPNIEIEIQQNGSSAGITAAIDGTAQIGMASRELKDSEKEKLEHMPIALDGIAVIVNQDNPIKDISIDNIKNIFTGEKKSWSDL